MFNKCAATISHLGMAHYSDYNELWLKTEISNIISQRRSKKLFKRLLLIFHPWEAIRIFPKKHILLKQFKKEGQYSCLYLDYSKPVTFPIQFI
jgi:hypothetical protein